MRRQRPGAPAISLPPLPPGVGGAATPAAVCGRSFVTAQGAWSNRVRRKKAKYRPSLQSTLDEGPVSEPFFLQPRGREPTGATFPCLTLVCASMTNHHNGVAENNRNVFLLAWRPSVCPRLWGGPFLPPSLRGPRAPLSSRPRPPLPRWSRDIIPGPRGWSPLQAPYSQAGPRSQVPGLGLRRIFLGTRSDP